MRAASVRRSSPRCLPAARALLCHLPSIDCAPVTQENYKTESAQTLALGAKLVCFQLFNFYLVLMLTAFYGENGGPCVADGANSLLLQQCRELELTGAMTCEPPFPSLRQGVGAIWPC